MVLEKIITYSLLYLIWMLLIGAFVLSILDQEWTIGIMALVTLILTLIPLFVQKKFKIYISHFFVSFIAFFLYASIFLGEIYKFYDRFWWWDLFLHLLSAIGLGILGVIVLLLFFGKQKSKKSAFMFSVFSFCFVVAIGVLWEIFEFSMDITFGLNMQKSGLLDTMSDLIIGCLGAGIIGIASYLYLTNSPYKFFSRIIENSYLINKALNRRKKQEDTRKK